MSASTTPLSAVAEAVATTTPRPEQHATALSQPYWTAAAENRFVAQKCAACGKLRHYPRLLCDNCYSDQVEWQPLTGAGKIHSWTVAHHAFHASFAAELPYTLVTIDLDEGVRALGRWNADPSLKLTIGMPVQGSFVKREGGIDLVFAPVQG